MDLIIMTTYTSIVKIKFIVHAHYVEGLLKLEKTMFRIGANLKKWILKYLTMNKISAIIIVEKGDKMYRRGNLNEFVAKD